MAPKRRATAAESDDPESSEIYSTQQRRRDGHQDANSDEGEDGGEALGPMVKKLVRLAISSEYSRIPIRRTDISQKVLGPNSRKFKAVFEATQVELRHRFGMELKELPEKDSVTFNERRAAIEKQSKATPTRSWVLISVLPDDIRTPETIRPPKVPTHEAESAYVGLYSFIIAAILLSGGALPEPNLNRYLKKVNADQFTPVDKTEKLLSRLIREQYIVQIKDSSNGDGYSEYRVGPRGKVEVGKNGVAQLVRTVYGEGAPEDLEERLTRSLELDGSANLANGDEPSNEQ